MNLDKTFVYWSQQGSSKVNFAYRTISGDSKEAEQQMYKVR